MKKLSGLLAIMLAIAMIATGCKANSSAPSASAAPSAASAAPAEQFKYGMVTDAGTIDDKSFNQGVWEGLTKAGTEFKFEPKYIKPANAQPAKADYLKEMANLYDSGYKFMVLPGYKFASAVYEAQEKYKDAKFVCIDYVPASDDGKTTKIGTNTVVINFAEHQSGFLAGVAATLQLKEGEIGFIGGMKVPAVQKFNWGFQQGVKYANEKFGTKCTMTANNNVYQGTFNDVAAGQTLAAGMFDAGCKAIFCAAGGVGIGAINEAKTRAQGGKEVWIIGVDIDQYNDGIYDDAKTKSVIITSAMKGVNSATYEMIKANIEGKFPGGQTMVLDITKDAVNIPATNPNLSKDVTDKVAAIYADLKAGKITVADKPDGLIEPAK